MQITFTVKPYKMEAATKDQLISKIRGTSIWGRGALFLNGFRLNGSYFYRDIDGKRTIRLYNLQKVRRKTKQTTRVIKRGIHKGQTINEVEVIRRGHWVAHVYDFPAEIVEKANQKLRNFDVVFKKNLV